MALRTIILTCYHVTEIECCSRRIRVAEKSKERTKMSESYAAATLLLSMAASSSLPPSKLLTSVATPVAKTITKPGPLHKEENNRNVQEHLIYVGVSLKRSEGESWGIQLFRVGEHLVVGGIQQDVMQGLVTWAWATETPPKQNGTEFRSSFGPLHATSLLQLVPGDVILSINGNTQVHSMCDTFASRLDIVAIRLESARRVAHECLRNMPHDANVHFLAAQAAFHTLEPVLMKTRTPKQCQRQLFPTLQPVARIVSDDAAPTRNPERKRSHQDIALQVSPRKDVTEPQFQKWLQVRQDQWRSDRSKKRRLFEPTSKPVAPPQHCPPQPQPGQLYHFPCQFLCFRLDRESLETPWGIHVSHHDGRFLGVGSVHDSVAARTSWAWATTSAISAELLNVKDEHSIRNIFASLPFHPSTMLQLQIGDFILSVSGHPVSSFASLVEIARFMTQVKSLTIIVLRHRIPSDMAQFAFCQGKSVTEITNLAFQSLMPVLYRSPNTVARLFHSQQVPFRLKQAAPVVIQYRNPLFQDEKGNHILYEDQGDLDVSGRASEFISSIDSESFPSWLRNRQSTWRQRWSSSLPIVSVDDEWCDDDESLIATDFWTQQGYATFDDWLSASTFKWKQSYSWNRKKRERLAKEFEEIVHYPPHGSERNENTVEQIRYWLRVRKQQWRLIRRKRQRRLELEIQSSTGHDEEANQDAKLSHNAQHSTLTSGVDTSILVGSARPAGMPRQTSGEMVVIDAFIEEQERKEQKRSPETPLDISFLFDSSLGAPDDVVAHCLEFLTPSDHTKLLFISNSTSEALKEREEVWRQLCPRRWILPRRPRKRWHEVYLTKIHDEVRAKQKWADDFLNKAADILFHQDNLTKIERLVEQGEKRVDFDINYISSVVAERNSLLNLAAIYSRAKVVRWLVETKNADIETFDRGGFTPLMNAAWSGDQKLVRYLLSRGADRTKVCHFFLFLLISYSCIEALTRLFSL